MGSLEALRASHFDKRTLTTRWPEMTVHNTYSDFSQTLFTRLGIGAGGDGGKALRLLARIQGGQQVRTVDGLAARDKAQAATRSLCSIFEAYQGRWPDPNLGVAIESYSGYRDILDNIIATGPVTTSLTATCTTRWKRWWPISAQANEVCSHAWFPDRPAPPA